MDFYTAVWQHQPRLMEPGRESAVLLPFVAKPEGWHLLFEIRASGLRSQPGEICFPGGGIEPGESPEQAARRETCEELLLEPQQVELWGAADLLHTPSGLTVSPYLGCLNGYEGTFSAQEVEQVFTVPVAWLMEHPPEVYRSKSTTVPEPDFPYYKVPGGQAYPWRSGRWPIYFYPEYQGHLIWGMTAKILYYTLEWVRELGGLPPMQQ